MKNKVLVVALAVLAIFATSCSKSDESFEPSVTPQQSIWVTYTHTVDAKDANIAYDIDYLSNKGMQTVKNHTGDFSVRVRVMTYDSAGATYARTYFAYKTVRSDEPIAPVINSSIKIVSDYGFVIAQTSLSDSGCGADNRVLNEVRPVSWFSIR